MSLRDPLATARGLGSAKTGFGHWWAQRVSAVVLALLTPFVVYCLARYGIADYAALKTQFANPLLSAACILYVLALFWHARLGLQVVIEDYVHHGALEVVLQVLVKIVFSFAAVAAVIAIVRLASGS
jgi:succinate dehydrogenase / fumarate reductase, membrane anchor subunit